MYMIISARLCFYLDFVSSPMLYTHYLLTVFCHPCTSYLTHDHRRIKVLRRRWRQSRRHFFKSCMIYLSLAHSESYLRNQTLKSERHTWRNGPVLHKNRPTHMQYCFGEKFAIALHRFSCVKASEVRLISFRCLLEHEINLLLHCSEYFIRSEVCVSVRHKALLRYL